MSFIVSDEELERRQGEARRSEERATQKLCEPVALRLQRPADHAPSWHELSRQLASARPTIIYNKAAHTIICCSQ